MNEEKLDLVLIKYRLEQADDSLMDAKVLLDSQRTPQSIVNRAYYAMFYAALALLQKIRKVPRKHRGVLSLFDTEFVLKGLFPKYLSKDFHEIFELRQVSDYQITEKITMEKAEKTLISARNFVQEVKTYLLSDQTSEEE